MRSGEVLSSGAVTALLAYREVGRFVTAVGFCFVVLACKWATNCSSGISARTAITAPVANESSTSTQDALAKSSDESIADCQGAEPGHHVCSGKAEVECRHDSQGRIVKLCPEACADGQCTCAYGPEPTCSAQPTAPCTEQGPNVPIIDIARGQGHTCALLKGGCVRCWAGSLRSTGDEATKRVSWDVVADKGQLGVPGRFRSDQRALWDIGANVPLGGKAIAVSAGAEHTCAILEGGCVRCWGANQWGQLGIGSTSSVGDDELPSSKPPVRLGAEAKSVSLGFDFSCALLADASVRCWGRNDYGQLGLGRTNNLGDRQGPLAACPVDVGDHAAMLSSGPVYVCALLNDHSIRCWGKGPLGQTTRTLQQINGDRSPPACEMKAFCIGDNEPPSVLPSVALPGPVISISAGNGHACAQLKDHSVHCWGNNTHYQLGFDLPEKSEEPTMSPTPFPHTAAAGVFALGSYTCTLSDSGSVFCVGSGRGRDYFKQDCCGRGRTIANGGMFPGIRRVPLVFRPKRLLGGPYGDPPCALASDTMIQCWNFP